MCQSVLPLVSCLICLRVQASLYARLVLVHIRKVSCSCGHMFVAKHNKHLLTPSRKHTLRSFRAIETVEKAVDQLTESLLNQERALETEEEALECKSSNRACVDFKVGF